MNEWTNCFNDVFMDKAVLNGVISLIACSMDTMHLKDPLVLLLFFFL